MHLMRPGVGTKSRRKFNSGGQGIFSTTYNLVHAKSLSGVRLFVTLWTVAGQPLLFTGFSNQEYWSGLPCLSPGNLPDPEIEPTSLMSPTLADEFFITSAT